MLHNEELRQPYKTLNTVRVLKWRGGGGGVVTAAGLSLHTALKSREF